MDVALLAEMLQTLVAGLLVLQDEAAPLGLQINWTKTKIQQVGEPRLTQLTVQVAAENVNLVNGFVYLGSLISHDGGSETEILRCIVWRFATWFSVLVLFLSYLSYYM